MMIDLGIGRVQDLQGALPEVRSLESIQGDRGNQQQPKPEAAPAEKASRADRDIEEKQVGPPLGVEEAEREVEKLNRLLGENQYLQFRVNKERGAIYIEVVDTRSGEVVKTIPPSEIRNVESRLRAGNLFIDNVS